jgi:hypothetical protein
MTNVVAARDAYLAAREQANRTRLNLGRAIAEARDADLKQEAIARELGLTREQIRRYQREYEKSLAGASS